jgi:hypothetical protein
MHPPTIDGIDAARAILGEFSLIDFSKVKELAFFSDDETLSAYDVKLSLLRDRPAHERAGLTFLFERASGVRLNNIGGGLTQIMGLYIKDISENGWEYLKWQIGDYENNAIDLYCFKVSIIAVELNSRRFEIGIERPR